MSSSSQERVAARFPKVSDRLSSVTPDYEYAGTIVGQSRDWDILLERWIEGLELKPNAALALSGLGDGSHLLALLERLPRGCFIFCAEPNINVAAACIQSEAGRKLVEDQRVYLGVGELDSTFFEPMAEFPVLECEAASPVIFSPLFFESENYFQSFFTEFARQLDYWRKLFGTNVTAAELWTRNTLRNLKSLIGAPDLSALSGKFKEQTLVLVSAGPSLDESIEFIRDMVDKTVVLALNSSYLPLRKAGIVPHFVLAADPNEDTAKGFRGIEVEGTCLICPFIVFPEVAERFEGSVVTWSDANLLASYLRLRLGEKIGSGVREQGTVAACAFDVARVLGCDHLVLVGQDFAARMDGKLHASGSFYDEMGEVATALDTCRWLPGNTLDKVPVEEKLYVYLRTFEALIEENKDWLKVVNTSRQGAEIEGARYLSLDEAVALREEKSAPDASVAFGAMRASEGITFESCLPLLSELKDYFTEIAKVALKGALKGETCQGRVSEEQVRELLDLRDQLADALERDSDFHKIFQESGLKYELLQSNQAIRKSRERDLGDIEREIFELVERFWAYAEGGFRFSCDIDAVLKGNEKATSE